VDSAPPCDLVHSEPFIRSRAIVKGSSWPLRRGQRPRQRTVPPLPTASKRVPAGDLVSTRSCRHGSPHGRGDVRRRLPRRPRICPRVCAHLVQGDHEPNGAGHLRVEWRTEEPIRLHHCRERRPAAVTQGGDRGLPPHPGLLQPRQEVQGRLIRRRRRQSADTSAGRLSCGASPRRRRATSSARAQTPARAQQ
jgi:hypothetical protein